MWLWEGGGRRVSPYFAFPFHGASLHRIETVAIRYKLIRQRVQFISQRADVIVVWCVLLQAASELAKPNRDLHGCHWLSHIASLPLYPQYPYEDQPSTACNLSESI